MQFVCGFTKISMKKILIILWVLRLSHGFHAIFSLVDPTWITIHFFVELLCTSAYKPMTHSLIRQVDVIGKRTKRNECGKTTIILFSPCLLELSQLVVSVLENVRRSNNSGFFASQKIAHRPGTFFLLCRSYLFLISRVRKKQSFYPWMLKGVETIASFARDRGHDFHRGETQKKIFRTLQSPENYKDSPIFFVSHFHSIYPAKY